MAVLLAAWAAALLLSSCFRLVEHRRPRLAEEGRGQLQVVPDASHATRTVIGEQGGVVVSHAADGTSYTLVVPPSALEQPTEVALAPLRFVQPLPLRRGMVAGVQLLPAGLELAAPATLYVEVPFGVNPVEIAGFSYQGAGEQLQLYPLQVIGSRLTMDVLRFGGFGAGNAAPGDIEQFAPPVRPRDLALHRLAALSEQAQAAGRTEADAQAMAGILFRWYVDAVRPLLDQGSGATSFAPMGQAGREYDAWLRAIRFATHAADDVESMLIEQLEEAREMAEQMVRSSIGLANRRCLQAAGEGEAIGAAVLALAWQGRAERWGLARPGSPLDPDAVLDALCVKVVFKEGEGVLFPAGIRPGQAGELTLQIGHEIRGRAPRYGGGIHVTIKPHGTGDLQPIAGETDPRGRLQTKVHWAPGASELRLDIQACIFTPSGNLTRICADAYVVRGAAAPVEDEDIPPLPMLEESQPVRILPVAPLPPPPTVPAAPPAAVPAEPLPVPAAPPAEG